MDGDREKANQINQSINDILALFDGINLTQSPENYDELLAKDKKDLRHSIEQTIPFTLPIALDKPEKEPTKIASFTENYDQKELISCLNLLKDKYKDHSFSLQINGSMMQDLHEINVNYDHRTGRWLLVDPTYLPGQEFIREDFLVNRIFFGFKQLNSVTMNVDIYGLSENTQIMRRQFLQLEKEPDWLRVHDLDKPEMMDPSHENRFITAVRKPSDDYQWIKANALKHPNNVNQYGRFRHTPLLAAIYKGDLTLVRLLIELNADVNQSIRYAPFLTPLVVAITKDRLDMAECLLEHQAELPLSLMSESLIQDKLIDVIDLLLKKGKFTLQQIADHACLTANAKVIKILVNNYSLSPIEILEQACRAKQERMVSFLSNECGLQPTERLLKAIAEEGNLGMAECLIEKAVSYAIDELKSQRNKLLSGVKREGLVQVAVRALVDSVNGESTQILDYKKIESYILLWLKEGSSVSKSQSVLDFKKRLLELKEPDEQLELENRALEAEAEEWLAKLIEEINSARLVRFTLAVKLILCLGHDDFYKDILESNNVIIQNSELDQLKLEFPTRAKIVEKISQLLSEIKNGLSEEPELEEQIELAEYCHPTIHLLHDLVLKDFRAWNNPDIIDVLIEHKLSPMAKDSNEPNSSVNDAIDPKNMAPRP